MSDIEVLAAAGVGSCSGSRNGPPADGRPLQAAGELCRDQNSRWCLSFHERTLQAQGCPRGPHGVHCLAPALCPGVYCLYPKRIRGDLGEDRHGGNSTRCHRKTWIQICCPRASCPLHPLGQGRSGRHRNRSHSPLGCSWRIPQHHTLLWLHGGSRFRSCQTGQAVQFPDICIFMSQRLENGRFPRGRHCTAARCPVGQGSLPRGVFPHCLRI